MSASVSGLGDWLMRGGSDSPAREPGSSESRAAKSPAPPPLPKAFIIVILAAALCIAATGFEAARGFARRVPFSWSVFVRDDC